ncbi:MAG: DNA polymerase III subunit gamma/tau [Spirochaetales bacterium]|nr:DNA polymerase III subunit gamma/tau [Spirochaetales bacterium]
MAYEVTATRKRPQRFEDLVGQEFVVSTLKNAIEQGRIAHAYLFSGPRGVGKTTSARLLAKALNCVHGPTAEPCGECDNCKGIAKGSSLDVIEIDGASNTGVNDVRVIKEEVMFPPTSSRYKIYIIDEVHMLSQSAFNALLKTIEEPPEYVVFIFATTETQKVPATIRSRCQQFNFQLIPLETIKGLLAQAATEMGIEAEDEALFWIAKESTGSMRDAYTLFDQVVAFSNGRITLAQIREKLGLVGVDRINAIMKDVLSKSNGEALTKIQALLAKGVSIDQIIKDFTEYFRSLLLIRKGVRSENVIGEQLSSFPEEILNAYNEEQLEAALDMFLNLYRDIRYSLNPRFELELAISKLSKLRYVASTASVIEQLARLKNDLINGTITPLNPSLADQRSVEPEKGPAAAPAAQPSSQELETEPVEVQPEQHQEMQPAQEPEPAPEPEPATEPEPAPEAKAADWKPEDIQDLLPQGTQKVENTEDGLVLTFNNKFFYQMAYRNLVNVREKIQQRTSPDLNVVLSYSENIMDAPAPAPEPEPVPTAEEPHADSAPEAAASEEATTAVVEEPAETVETEEPEVVEPSACEKPQNEKRTEEQRNLLNDLMLCFDGREER